MSITNANPPNLINQKNPSFRKNDFEGAIWRLGYDIIISKACKCVCQTNDNHSLPDCQNCNGLGWFWINPIATKGILHSINLNTKFKEWSEELLGTNSLSIRDNTRLSYMDKIVIKNSPYLDNKVIYSEVLTLRGDVGSEFVFMSYKPIDLISVHVFQGSSKPLLFLNSPTYSIASENEYVLKFDFDFSSISDFNGVVTILYAHELEYYVLDIPHDIRNSMTIDRNGKESQIVLPVNAIVRKANNVLNLKDRSGNGIQDNSIPAGVSKWILQNGKWLDSGVFSDSSIWND
jgi:hypothetical protein